MKEVYEGCNIEDYLKRIGFEGEARPDLETLKKVQELHVISVPYENLELLARKPLTLDIPAIYDKIVTRGRGGYCFELNGLFKWLLEGIGFDVTQHFGRWLMGEPLAVPMRRHRILRVPIDGKEYIADVGVGHDAAHRLPLLFELDTLQEVYEDTYRIVRHPINIYVVEYIGSNGEFQPVYCFNDDPCVAIDFFQSHWYCTTHPDTWFINATLVFRRTANGRKTIADAYDPLTGEKVKELRVLEDGTWTTKLLLSDKEFDEALKTHFGFGLDT